MKTKTQNIIMSVSGFLLVLALVMHLFNLDVGIRNIILTIASLLAGFPTLVKALKSASMKMFSIELLVSIAVIGALIIGEYAEAAIVTFLFLFGAFLETRTLEKARASLQSLLKMSPLEAVVERNGNQFKILAEEVEIGEHVIIHSGGKIPVDGKIISGQAFINEATITGESVPVEKSEGSKVFSSTVLDNGYIVVEAEKIGEDTTFAKILDLVEEAQESKAKTQRFLEKFASFYTPGILVLSVIVLLVTWDFHLSLTFLVIACPGALVISAPVSIVAGIGNAAKKGILIKGGNIMESLSKVNAIVFDKTGTLTQGKPVVSAIKTFGISENELLQLASDAEMASEHHLAHSILAKAKSMGIKPKHNPENVKIFKGGGLKAHIQAEFIFIGNRKLLTEHHIPITPEIDQYMISEEEKGLTAVFVAKETKILGVISIVDQIRANASEVIVNLKKNGISHIAMLTGDNNRTAQKVARNLGIDQVFSELLPEDKASKIKSCMKKGVNLAMVGDGINDAPAVATADVGIAMGGAAADSTMETADIVLMNNNLEILPYAQKLSKATILNMKQNMFFSVGVVFLLLVGVLTGHIRLASGMFIHEISVLLVILNAVRLVRYPKYQIHFKAVLEKILKNFNFRNTIKKKQLTFNGCSTNSLEEFKICSKC